ncbi:hypothetical protein DAEQUDRAFT_739027 [Daedalea quercina L-15889]|uniref:DUF6533 domain-containing protein n=1 Tax=Daedalea quercina L-15889 TaxID=1314783 RepID=A0A165P9F9_9APHY|nr:hypothetical protein DAEQUDRAFT_739027 [Daedalea quercina L-15889]
MSSVPTAEAITIMNILLSENYVNAAAIALLVFDYILTLGSEIELFWCRGPLVSKLSFFSLRLSILAMVFTTIPFPQLNLIIPVTSSFQIIEIGSSQTQAFSVVAQLCFLLADMVVIAATWGEDGVGLAQFPGSYSETVVALNPGTIYFMPSAMILVNLGMAICGIVSNGLHLCQPIDSEAHVLDYITQFFGLQLLLLYRLLINLRKAAGRSMQDGDFQRTPIGNDDTLGTSIELSTLALCRSEAPNNGEEHSDAMQAGSSHGDFSRSLYHGTLDRRPEGEDRWTIHDSTGKIV